MQQQIDVLKVLDNYEKLSESEKAWVMTTLLDFMWQHQDEFNSCYGTYARGIIHKLEV